MVLVRDIPSQTWENFWKAFIEIHSLYENYGAEGKDVGKSKRGIIITQKPI